MKILLSEDEKSLAKAIRTILSRNAWIVDVASDGQEALELIDNNSYDVIVLDIMMPNIDGITVLKTIRAYGNLTPVLMLTAKSEVDDKVTGLEAGANDYLTKPFHSKELMARIQALARAQTFQNHPQLTLGNVTIDREDLELSTPTGCLRLAHQEFQMLELMMTNPKSKIPQERFLEKIWKNEGTDVRIIPIYIAYLNNKLQALCADIHIITTKDLKYGIEPIGREEERNGE